MRMVATVAEMCALREELDGSVGLVPTMGYLHEGHLSLVRRARAECDAVVVSVFVNPTQFDPNEDLDTYPRDLDRDLRLLEGAGVEVVFAPTVEEMYPGGRHATVDPGPIARRLEGAARPGHFRGVATVVARLLDIAQPDCAYFGEKDAQQLLVVKEVVESLRLPVRVVGCPTVREPDGLALSSRNVYLTPDDRRAAPAIYRGLSEARRLWRAGERSGQALRSAVRVELDAQPLLKTEYVSLADGHTLEELERAPDRGALLSVAVRAGEARLIDNVRLENEEGL